MNRPGRKPPEHGVALVTTVIVIAVLAIVAVAFIQSTSLDRLTSRSAGNYFRAQLAAEAGLADAMAQMASAITNFNYVSGMEIFSGRPRTYLRTRTAVQGAWTFPDNNIIYLDSGTNAPTTELLVAGSNSTVGVVVQAAYKTNELDQRQTNRYAFWVDEAGSKQNIAWWGGETTRGLVTNVASLQVMLPSADGATATVLPPGAMTAMAAAREQRLTNSSNYFGRGIIFRSILSNQIATPASLNLFDPAFQRRASGYFYTLYSPSTASTPVGGQKLNLRHLASYLGSGLSTAQGAGTPRTLLVEQLLSNAPTVATNWGGGDLSWLATNSSYSDIERRQIVANLIDYLDDDIIPTTDSVDAPTYFGLEMRADGQGLIRGHPFINFISTGLIFNRNTNTGVLNSTRVLSSIGVAYPWASSNVATADYTPEIAIRIDGRVQNGISSLPGGGTDATNYFAPKLEEQLTVTPASTFRPFSANNWPESVGLAGSASYATRIFGASRGDWGGTSGPSNITFNNLVATITQLRLLYTPSGGGDPGYVQIIPTNLTITLATNSIVAGGVSPRALQVKFSAGGAYSNTANLYLAGDPRAHFRAATWTNLASVASFSTNIPTPSASRGAAAVVLTNGVNTNVWDGAQSLPMTMIWYASTNATNHLSRAPTNGIQSIGEIGYLWTGQPWRTLNLTRTNPQPTNDWNLLDYLSGGYVVPGSSTNVTTMPLQIPTSTNSSVTISNGLVQDGGFNILTRKGASVTAFLQGASGLAANAVSQFTNLPRPDQPALGGVLATMTNLSAQSGTKFAREEIVRTAANAAVMQSRVFTVYSLGEFASVNVRSSALLEADVFVDVNPQTGAPLLRVLSKRFR